MTVLVRICPTCGQANPQFCQFCPNCGTLVSTIKPTSLSGDSTEQFFNIPEPLRLKLDHRRVPSAHGAGWSWLGTVMIFASVIFSIQYPLNVAVWFGGIALAIVGFWQMRHDFRLMMRAGRLIIVAAISILGLVLFRLLNPPELIPLASEIHTAAISPVISTAVTYAPETLVEATQTVDYGTVAMFRGDASHTGQHPGPAPIGNPMLTWKFDAGGEVYSSAAAIDGTLYVGSKSGSLYAIDMQTGSRRWTFDLDDSVIVRSSPVVADGRVYIGAGYGFYAIDLETGQQLWRIATAFLGQSSPTMADGVIYICSQEGYIYAVQSDSGEELWHSQIAGLIFSSPAVVDGAIYVGSDDGRIYAINTLNGQIKWSFDTGGSVFAAPTVVGDKVYITSDSKNTFAIDAESGKRIWQYSVGGEASPASMGDLIFIASDDGGLYALNADTGSPEWLFPTGSPITTSPVIASQTIFVASGRGLYAVDITNGKMMWSYVTSDVITSSPTAVDGHVYVGTRDGFLYAIGGDGVMTSSVATP